MLRAAAVSRINQGLGHRPDGNQLEPKIINALIEAQKDLQNGKTIPRFLLQELQPLTLTAGTHTVTLPTGFMRPDDDVSIHFYPVNSSKPTFLSQKRSYRDAVLANLHSTAASSTPDEPVAPSVYFIMRSVIDFITTADITYNLLWNYYKKADELTTNIENAWLADDAGQNWLIGEAGWRIAMDGTNVDAVTKFDTLRKAGRAACLGETIAFEEAGGPIIMGANL